MTDFARRDTSRFFRESYFIVEAGPSNAIFMFLEKRFETGGGQTTNGQKMTRKAVIFWGSPLKWPRSKSRFSWGLKCCAAGLPMSYKLGPRWDGAITWSDFKSEAIFGFLSPKYTGHDT